jgi:deoxyribonucleoside regulator
MYPSPLLVKVSEMYFYQKLSQSEIAKRLDVSIPTVSRMINMALESGIVKVEVRDFQAQADEVVREVKDRFDLNEIVVVTESYPSEQRYLKKMLAKNAVDLLYKLTRHGSVVGIGPGETIYEMTESIDPKRPFRGVKILPMMGGWGIGGVEYEVNKLVSSMATRLGCDFNLIMAPALVDSPEVKDIILRQPQIEYVISMWQTIDVAVFSIGPEIQSGSYPQLSGESAKLDEARRAQAVGDVLGRFIDAAGNEASLELNRRLISLPFYLLEKIPARIGIGGGIQKMRAVKAALKGGLVNALVTDYETCVSLLKED